MDTFIWILLPGIVAVASGVLSWFVMQSRMEVKLAELREKLATERGSIEAEREAMKNSLETSMRATEEAAKRQALDSFLNDINIEQRHYTRDNRLLLGNRKSLVLQERMYFRNIPLSDWVEHEIVMDEGADINRL